MIEVPERVKDALRQGNKRKEYEITVRSSYDVVTYADIFTFNTISDICNVPKVGTFEWYAEGFEGLVGYYSIEKTDGTTVTGDITVGAEIDCGYGDTLTVTSMNVMPIILRQKFVESEMRVDFVIGNDNLVKESVKFDERMATGKDLKFGLCEGSSLEFQYFNLPNINNKQLEVIVKIQYTDSENEDAWYSIPMGFYTVDQCPMQFNTGIYKVTAYNKLRSKYLDQKANALIEDAFSDLGMGQTVKFYDLRRMLLNDYEIEYYNENIPIEYTVSLKIGRCSAQSFTFKGRYGFNTPLSWFQYEQEVHEYPPPPAPSFPSVLYTFSASTVYEATLNPEKGYVLSIMDTIEEYEEAVYNTIIDVINKSMTVSGQSYVNAMMSSRNGKYGDNYGGWSDFCGVVLTKEDNSTERYSTIGFKKSATGVVGTFDDLRLKTLSGYKYISIHIPSRLNFGEDKEVATYWVDYYFTANPNSRNHPYWPYGYYYGNNYSHDYYYDRYCFMYPNTNEAVEEEDCINFIKTYEVNLSDADFIDVDPKSLADITLRDTLTAVYELDACYGKLDRITDLFAPIELNQGGLCPQDTLYPADGLYPQGNMLHPFPSSYSKLWTDTVGEQSFKYLIITYKTIDGGQETERTLQRTVNVNGTTNYNMSDNWLLKNLVWTAEEVGAYADAMVEKMRDIRWFPFELWGVGMPHIEPGDAIEITDKNGDTHTSYVLQRQLNGIQNLQDTYINGELDIF